MPILKSSGSKISLNLKSLNDDFEIPRDDNWLREKVLGQGAYGKVMASNYNSRPKACEILIDGDQSKIIRQRETLDDLLEKEKIENG